PHDSTALHQPNFAHANMATTAGHFGIETPRSEADQIHSLNADNISFASQEPSFVSPTKPKQETSPTTSKNFMPNLPQPTGSPPLGEIKNDARAYRFGTGKNEFTPLLKSVAKTQFMKRGFASQTPSKLRHVLAKSASTSDLHEMSNNEEGFSAIGEES